MSIKNILTVPAQELYQKSQKITEITESIRQLSQDLLETGVAHKNPEAAGLAAPQIGENLRIILVRDFKVLPNTEKLVVTNTIMINPRIISKSKETNLDWESCLSIPNMYGKVKRHSSIKLTYQDVNGKEHKLKASDFFARVVQHEIDHLDGILFTEKLVGKLITEKEYNSIIENE